MIKYDYKNPKNKRILICEDSKAKPVTLMEEESFEEMGRLGYLTGAALKDYEAKYGIPE